MVFFTRKNEPLEEDRRVVMQLYKNNHSPVSWWKHLPVLVLFILALSLQYAFAAMKGEFNAPAIDTFIFHGESDGDGDGDGINETRIRRYLNKNGDSIFSMSSGDRLWAWSLSTQGSEESDLEKNYVIRDSNCDGIFDEKYGLEEEFHVPECITN